MNSQFPRIITLLRKERKLSQKTVAEHLEVSQALLSHYEKGIRECGLDFVVKTAKYYNVSCDYLLGLSLDKQGNTISSLEIPEPDELKDNVFKGSLLPTLNKKLIANSLNIIFDIIQKQNNKTLTTQVSQIFMLSVYKVFRMLFSLNPNNNEKFFNVPKCVADAKIFSAMFNNQSNIISICSDDVQENCEKIQNKENIIISSESLSTQYPLYSSSLLSLIQHTENVLSE